MIDAKSLPELLDYDPETGKLYWRMRTPLSFGDGVQTAEHRAARWNSFLGGKEAFTTTMAAGYRQGRVDGRLCYAHRVIWALVHGEWPTGEIDHVNGIRDDNRIANLRVVTSQGNKRNRARRHDNQSGVTGVYWQKQFQRWEAHIRVNGRNKYLGRFHDFTDAVAARKAAEAKYGFHANHDRPA